MNKPITNKRKFKKIKGTKMVLYKPFPEILYFPVRREEVYKKYLKKNN